MAKPKSKTKSQLIAEEVESAVNAGAQSDAESLDFANPRRALSCLEVDFPIIPVNRISSIEAASGAATKSVYQMGKWWARRQSSVFRTMLLAAATKAPENSADSAAIVWKNYYNNHQTNEHFSQLRVADIFMGGGTTIVEGSRLGMQMTGVDLNPVAWLVVNNETASLSETAFSEAIGEIETKIGSETLPFYACSCPRGHYGNWTDASGKSLGDDFDPLGLDVEDRQGINYQGPQIVYTFWAKHGPCQSSECDHKTPIISSPVVASRSGDKALSVKFWNDIECPDCGFVFDLEQRDIRLSPNALFVSNEEKPFAFMSPDGDYSCPKCKVKRNDLVAADKGKSAVLGKASSRKVTLTVLLHPSWIKGAKSLAGGTTEDHYARNQEWNLQRVAQAKLIEVRGKLPDKIVCPETGVEFFTNEKGGTVPGKSKFTCQDDTCGLAQGVLDSVKKSGTNGPVSPYAVQVYCPECDAQKYPGNGRYFVAPDAQEHLRQFAAADKEWEERSKNDLAGFWPVCELSYLSLIHI